MKKNDKILHWKITTIKTKLGTYCCGVFSRIEQIYGFISFVFEHGRLSCRVFASLMWCRCRCPSTLLGWLQTLHSS